MSIALTVVGLVVAVAAGAAVVFCRRGLPNHLAAGGCFAAFVFEVLATFQLSADRVPGWMVIVSAVGLAVTFAILPIPLHFRRSDGEDDGDDGGPRPDDDGGGPRRPHDEPPWWPQFERDFWGHLDRQRAQPRDPVAT